MTAKKVKSKNEVFTSMSQFEKRYFPLKHEADKVREMNDKEYFDWFFKTPEKHRDKIIKLVGRRKNRGK